MESSCTRAGRDSRKSGTFEFGGISISNAGRHGIFATGQGVTVERNEIRDCGKVGIYVGNIVTVVGKQHRTTPPRESSSMGRGTGPFAETGRGTLRSGSLGETVQGSRRTSRSRRVRIAFANNYYYLRGGSERVFFDEISVLEGVGHQIAVFSREHASNVPTPYSRYFPPHLHYEGVPAARKILAAASLVYSSQCGRKFGELLEDFRPDLVHGHNIYGRLTTAILDAARTRGRPDGHDPPRPQVDLPVVPHAQPGSGVRAVRGEEILPLPAGALPQGGCPPFTRLYHRGVPVTGYSINIGVCGISSARAPS